MVFGVFIMVKTVASSDLLKETMCLETLHNNLKQLLLMSGWNEEKT